MRRLRVPALSILCLLLPAFAGAQQATAKKTTKKKPTLSDQVGDLRHTVEQQQHTIERLMQKLDALESARAEQAEATRAAQAKATAAHQLAEQSSSQAQQAHKAAEHAEFRAAEGQTAEILHEDATKGESKKIADADSFLKRFRFSGDIRVRFEPMFQDLTPDRYRGRLRARFGLEGALSEDVTGGFYLATGTVNDDPVATNATFTQFFTRKPIGVDRGWITYQPLAHKWLALTGGKFAFTWARTSATFDPDLNPEGFSEKLSFDLKNAGMLKNVSATGMQLFVNEVVGSNGIPFQLGNDSFAYGGQVSARLQWNERVSTTFSGTALNWINADSVIKAVTARTLAGNRQTNATVGAGANIVYLSQFLYTDYMAETVVKTWGERWPLRLTLDFIDNLRAATDQRHAFYGEIGIGQARNLNDMSFSYAFARIEQDAVLSAFNESEMRAPTNVLQHRIQYLWQARKNTLVSVNTWIGRTLDRDLQNAALPPNLPPGEKDPYVKRFQFDVIYKF